MSIPLGTADAEALEALQTGQPCQLRLMGRPVRVELEQPCGGDGSYGQQSQVGGGMMTLLIPPLPSPLFLQR